MFLRDIELEVDNHLFSLTLMQELVVGVLPVVYIQSLHIWHARIVDMQPAIEESQENTEIMRRHEAHGRFWLLYTQKQY